MMGGGRHRRSDAYTAQVSRRRRRGRKPPAARQLGIRRAAEELGQERSDPRADPVAAPASGTLGVPSSRPPQPKSRQAQVCARALVQDHGRADADRRCPSTPQRSSQRYRRAGNPTLAPACPHAAAGESAVEGTTRHSQRQLPEARAKPLPAHAAIRAALARPGPHGGSLKLRRLASELCRARLLARPCTGAALRLLTEGA